MNRTMLSLKSKTSGLSPDRRRDHHSKERKALAK